MNWDYRFHPAARFLIQPAQAKLQVGRIHRVTLRIDVDEERASPHLEDGIDGGQEGERNRCDKVAWADS